MLFSNKMNRKELVKQIELILGDFTVYKWIPIHDTHIEDESQYIHFHIIRNIGFSEIEKRIQDTSKLNYVYYIEYQIIKNVPYVYISLKDANSLLDMRNKFHRKINEYNKKLQRVEECLHNISKNSQLVDNLL